MEYLMVRKGACPRINRRGQAPFLTEHSLGHLKSHQLSAGFVRRQPLCRQPKYLWVLSNDRSREE